MGKNIPNYGKSWRHRKYSVENRYDEDEDYYGFGYGFGERFGHRRLGIDLHEAVDPLIRQLEAYDQSRQKLEKHGGTIKDFAFLSNNLSKEIYLESYNGQAKVALTDPVALRSELNDIKPDLHLQVR